MAYCVLDYCRVSSFSEPLAAHYFTQASLAIIYLHERGVYHRDIKPENCVLDEHFNLKLTDFGTNKVCTCVCIFSIKHCTIKYLPCFFTGDETPCVHN